MANEMQAKCEECGKLLSAVEAAGRQSGVCNECLDRRVRSAALIAHFEFLQAEAARVSHPVEIDPSDPGRTIDAAGNMSFSMAWILAHETVEDRPVVAQPAATPATPASVETAQEAPAMDEATLAEYLKGIAAEGDPRSDMPADAQSMLLTLAGAAELGNVLSTYDLSQDEQRLCRYLVAIGLAEPCRVTDPRPGVNRERAAWTVTEMGRDIALGIALADVADAVAEAPLVAPLKLTRTSRVGFYYRDQEGRAVATVSGAAERCAICGAPVSRGYSVGPYPTSRTVCASHVEIVRNDPPSQ